MTQISVRAIALVLLLDVVFCSAEPTQCDYSGPAEMFDIRVHVCPYTHTCINMRNILYKNFVNLQFFQ